jgi:hypothetical protein
MAVMGINELPASIAPVKAMAACHLRCDRDGCLASVVRLNRSFLGRLFVRYHRPTDLCGQFGESRFGRAQFTAGGGSGQRRPAR